MDFWINAIFIAIIAGLFILALIFYIKSIKKGSHCGGCSGCVNCSGCPKQNECQSENKQFDKPDSTKK